MIMHFAGRLPAAVVHLPLSFWFRGKLEGFAREVLLSRRSSERNIFNPRAVAHLLDLHRGGRPLDLQLWTLISFELWCRTFLDRQPIAAKVRATA